jgi:mono/diheme cytochrome c family protein
MPGFRYTLSDQQIADVIAFLGTVPASSKPTEAQLAGQSGPAQGD